MKKFRVLTILIIPFILLSQTAQARDDENGKYYTNTKARLGGLLYFDTDLSINKNQACASCHTPPHFVDPANVADPANSVVSLGSDTTLNGGRNSPSAAYAAFSPFFSWDPVEGLYVGGQFWDGRATTLTEQAKAPFLNPVEMAMPTEKSVLKRIASYDNVNFRKYKKLFKKVYDVDIVDASRSYDQIVIDAVYAMMADAIAAFEKTGEFNKFSSKFDYYLAGKTDLSAQELRGMTVFNGKAKCNACHTSDALIAPDGSVMPPLFTDFTYDNIGIPKSTNPLIADNPIDYGLGGREDIAAKDPTGAELGKHKVMTLRNIEITPPYGHNGFFATLEEIVNFYNTRDIDPWPAPEVEQNVNTEELGDLGLSAEEGADIVAFLKTLTDGFGPPLNDFAFPPFP